MAGQAPGQTLLCAVARYWDAMDYCRVAENLRESFRVVAANRASGEVRELRGVSIASAGVTSV